MHATKVMQQWYTTMDVERLLADDVDWEIASGFPEADHYLG